MEQEWHRLATVVENGIVHGECECCAWCGMVRECSMVHGAF